MINKKKEVSKGLRTLLSNIEKNNNPVERTQLVKELASNIISLKSDIIEVNPYQPRTEFDNEQLLELAKSIKISGLIQPITVRSLGSGKYQLISGERRLRASKMAGITEIPAYIRVANDQEMLEMALVENIQRADLNAIEVAISYQRLMDECNLTHEALSDRVGKERSTISNYVRLLKLPPPIQAALKENKLSMGHARALAGIENIGLQLQMFHKCIDQHLSVRALESLIREYNIDKTIKQTIKNKPQENPEVQKFKQDLSNLLGSKVDIKRSTNGQGQIVIKFSNDEEFNHIIHTITDN